MIALTIIVVTISVLILVLTYIPSAKTDPEPPRTIPGVDGQPVPNPAWQEWLNRMQNGGGGFWGKVRAAIAKALGAIGGTKTLFWILLILLIHFLWRHRSEWPRLLRPKA